jgi:hypothetical protein
MIGLSAFFKAALKVIPNRNKLIGNAFSELYKNQPESLRDFAKRLGVGRETIRVAAQNDFIFKSDTMTARVESGLARINASMIEQQRFTVGYQMVWTGEDALSRLPVPLNNGELPQMVKFTTLDPEQEFISDGRILANSKWTTSDPVNVGTAPLLELAQQALGLDPTKIVRVTFR